MGTNIQNFITLSNAGLSVKTYAEIRKDLIERYKSIYGSDIDVSDTSADGIFLNDIALLINSMLQTMNSLYTNLNVDTASGVFLDSLCKLSNIYRKAATYSIATLKVTNNGLINYSLAQDELFVDDATITWVNTSGAKTIAPGAYVYIDVKCENSGPITAPAGWIHKTVLETDLSVLQENAANVGSYQETDSQLRLRRSQQGSGTGVTILESLKTSLLNLSGVKDCYIINNNTGADIAGTYTDGTLIPAHNIYAVVRRSIPNNGNTNDGIDNNIGNIIYEKLTPGVRTTQMGNGITSGKDKSYTYIPSIGGTSIQLGESTIYWKEAIPQHPTINFTITPESFFTIDEKDAIGASLIDYFNNLQINTDLNVGEVITAATNADPYFQGRPTYKVTNVTIGPRVNLTYFDYNINDVTVTTSTIKLERSGS